MKLFSYYALHTFINSIKKLFRSTFVIVIAAMIAIGVIFGVGAGLVASSFEDNAEMSEELGITDEEVVEDGATAEEEVSSDEASEDEMDAETAAFVKACIEAGVEGLMIIFLLWGLYAGSKKGSDIFLMADVNFLFTAPLKAQSVLMFRLTFQMAATLLGSVYLLFQIPNLVINAGLDVYAIIAIFMAWIFLIIFQKLVSVLAYTITATYEKLKRYIIPLIIVVVSALTVVTGGVYLSVGKDLEKMLSILYTSNWSRMIPMIGWYKGMIMTAVDGEIVASLVYFALLLLGMGIMIFFIWRIKADFYEDAMSGAQTRDEILIASKEGRKVDAKKRSDKIKRNDELSGFGASTFFTKEMYNRKRFAKFGVLTNTMLTYLGVTILTPLFCSKALDVHSFIPTGFILAGFVFFRNFGNPIAAETSKNWLFLVPDSPYKKVFFAMTAGTCSCALDLIPGVIIGTIISEDKITWIIPWMLMLVTMDFMLSAVGMLLEAIFPATALDVAKSMIQMVLKFFMIMIEILLFVAGMAISGVMAGLLVCALGNAVIGAAIFLIYPSLLHDGLA